MPLDRVEAIGEPVEATRRERSPHHPQTVLDLIGFLVPGQVLSTAYGRCTECGRDIEPGRLAAIPEAATCLQCQEDQERRRAANHVA